MSNYSWENQQLRKNGKLVVGNDSELRKELLSFFHDSATSWHSGINETYMRISAILFWKNL